MNDLSKLCTGIAKLQAELDAAGMGRTLPCTHPRECAVNGVCGWCESLKQATAAERVRLARWLRDEAYCLDGSDQKGTRDTLLRHADCLDAMREAMGGE